MAIHNYIRRKAKEDLEYERYVHQKNQNVSQTHQAPVAPDDRDMDEFRDKLASKIATRIESHR